MTLSEIKASDKPMLTPADVAGVLGVDAHSVRVAARLKPELLGFNVAVVGSRTLIPRVGFLRWMDGIKDNVLSEG